jgi:predicted MPP superfamily phosphohydrolase
MSWSNFLIAISSIIALNEELDKSKHFAISSLFKNKAFPRAIIIIIYLFFIVFACTSEKKSINKKLVYVVGVLSSFILWEEYYFVSLVAYNALGTLVCLCSVNWLIPSVEIKLIVTIALVTLHLQYCSLGPIIHETHTQWPRLLQENKRIVHISDLHIGPTCRQECVRSIVDKVGRLRKDIIVITGDIIDGKLSWYIESIEILGSLPSQAHTIMVTGNHDHMHEEIDELLNTTGRLGIMTLRNEAIDIEGLHIIGIDDVHPRKMHIDQPSIVLVHRPNLIDKISGSVKMLILAGHTHCGQMLPMMPLVWFFNYPYVCG